MQASHDIELDDRSHYAKRLGCKQAPDLAEAMKISRQLPNPSHVQLKEIISSYRKQINSSTKLRVG